MPCPSRLLPLSVVKDVIVHADPSTCIGAWTQVSSKTRQIASSEIRARHQYLFEQLTEDVDALFGIMRKWGAVLAGSAVVHLLCPIFDDVRDYDFFVPVRGVDELVEHFVSVGGYRRDDTATYHCTNGCSVGELRYLSGIAIQVTLVRGGHRVDIIGVGLGDDWDSALAPIASSWTTLLFNYATADWVVSGYPSLTMRGRALVQWDRAYHHTFPCGTRLIELEKYVARGFQFQTHADEWDVDARGKPRPCNRSWVCPLMMRSFEDGGSLRIAVGNGDDNVVKVKWKLGGVPCPSVCDDTKTEKERPEVHVQWCACM